MRLVAPSLLASDFLHLSQEVEFVNECGDILHLDVMDGVLVPNISFGFSVVDAVARLCRRPMDVHLMIVNPQNYIDRFAEAGAAMISFHLEAARLAGEDPSALLEHIRSLGVKAGLVINPDVPVEDVYPYIGNADYILLMSVFAGFGGQSFIEATYDRLRALRSEISRQGASCLVEVDGGVTLSNADAVAEAGAQILVTGSAVFHAQDRKAAVNTIRGSQII